MLCKNEFTIGALSALLIAGVSTLAQDFEITRSTIDGGGVMFATGGDFELSGTIGQPDAGTQAGGGFELSGGFWFPVVPGDFNEDGAVSSADVASFATCASGPSDNSLVSACAPDDLDGDGDVDLADFAAFQNAVTSR